MKIAVILLVCVSAALCAPHERGLFDNFHLTDLFNLDALKADLQIILDVLGADPTEQACEAEAHTLLQTGHILHEGVPLVCKSFQALVGHFNLHPTVPPTATTV